MEEWISGQPGELGKSTGMGYSLFAESEEEQWRRLKEEAMIDSDDEEDLAERENIPVTEPKKRRQRNPTKTSTAIKNGHSQQQQKLTHAISSYDMEKLLKQYRDISAEEEGVGVDITRFLQDDGNDCDKDEEYVVTADELLSSLTTGKSTNIQRGVDSADSVP
ncbi:unnamed protein product [Trypanosoma congolense IL3000]|uniref:WGS project CAEQ00000000 data, annotated contig 7 n=1 Tax=Trypanosoma congolense (strain IL3000) TaxID=1068625 RepID=F9WI15_TRYCI|nr:unnamed protein product [Trypanosoma congolense IL3000]